MTIGERILEAAKQKKLSQGELSKMLGISQASVSAWKTGSVPSSDKIVPLAEILGVSIEYLLTGEPQKQTLEQPEAKSAMSDLEVGLKIGRLEGRIEELEKLVLRYEVQIQKYDNPKSH